MSSLSKPFLVRQFWRASSCRRLHGQSLSVNGARTSATARPSMKPPSHGQPTFLSHPHLVKKDEITPGIPREEFEERRRRLMQRLPEGSMVVSVAGSVKYMSGEIFYKYRQASDFWYLTGFQEPDSAVILEKTSTSRDCKMTLFCRGSDAAREKWEGARTSFGDAASIFGADDVLPITSFPDCLRSLASLYSYVYVDVPSASSSSRRTFSKPKSLMRFLNAATARSDADAVIESLSSTRRRGLAPELAQLRSMKSEAEVKVMRAAADISGRAHTKTMRLAQPGLSESLLAAHFEYLCAREGAQRLAYVPVVASGSNALIIHYTSNDQVINDGELVLIDAGCEYNGYASDITRTFPTNGTFNPAQRDLYAAVLAAQKACVVECTARAALSLNELHRRSAERLREELNQLGFNLERGEVERVLYPHFLGHPIGIDLHESAHFDRGAQLTAGMVVTVEPGIYVPPSSSYPKHFHNLGIRIEDEVLVQKDHPLVLTIAAPKEIADIEGACQGSLGLTSL